MGINIRRLGILVALSVVLILGMALLAFSYSDVGVTVGVGTGGLPLSVPDLSAVPESVAEDAAELAKELFEDYREELFKLLQQFDPEHKTPDDYVH